MAKKLYKIPLPAQAIQILYSQEATKKPKDKPEVHGFEVTFVYLKLVITCFMKEKPQKEGAVVADLEVMSGYDNDLALGIVNIKK